MESSSWSRRLSTNLSRVPGRRRASGRCCLPTVLHPTWPGIPWPILVRPAWLRLPADDVRHMLENLIDPVRRERQERHFRLGLSSPDARKSLDVFRDICNAMETQLKRKRWLAGEEYTRVSTDLRPRSGFQLAGCPVCCGAGLYRPQDHCCRARGQDRSTHISSLGPSANCQV
jgi:hypothetical protein